MAPKNMSESLEISIGTYRHKKESLKYRVLGIGELTQTPPEVVEEIGVALGVAGYEETHEITGEKIFVYKLAQPTERQKSNIIFTKVDQFDPPQYVVIYEQLEQGQKYKSGQLWWRPIENFLQHFDLLNS